MKKELEILKDNIDGKIVEHVVYSERHREFLMKLKKKNLKAYCELEFLGESVKGRITAQDRYGELNFKTCHILNGHNPTIGTAIDKHEYFLEMLKENNEHAYNTLSFLDKVTKLRDKVLATDEYGEVLISPERLLAGHNSSIKNAVDKNEYFLTILKSKNPRAIETLLFLEKYTSVKKEILVKDKYGLLKITPDELLCGRIPTILRSIDKNKYFSAQCEEKHPNKFIYDKVIYVKNNIKVKVFCKKCQEYFSMTPNTLLSGCGCQKCGIKKQIENSTFTLDFFIKVSNKTHNFKYDYSEAVYTKAKNKIKIICLTHGAFWQEASSHMQGNGCPKCAYEELGISKMKSHDLFIEELRRKNPKILDEYVVIGKYNGAGEKIKISGKYGLFEMSPNTLLQGCLPSITSAVDKTAFWEAVATEKHKGFYKYGYSQYKNMDSIMSIHCPLCNIIFPQKADVHLQGKGCPYCSMSKGEKMVLNFLNKNNFTFTTQKTFDGCRDSNLLLFDFYLDDYNIIIEYDGKGHFMPVRFGGISQERAEKNFEYCKYHDEIKNNFCKDQNIPLLRIPYWDFDNIEKIIEKFLEDLG